MKKGLIVMGLGVLALSSCVKDRNCVCVSTDTSINYSETNTYVYKTTKKTAEASCALNEETYGTYSTTCTLD